MSPREYINRFRKFIQNHLKGTPLLPSVLMAHAMHEAADDEQFVRRSVHAVEFNNDARVIADDSWKGPRIKLPTRDKAKNGRPKMAWFRIYNSPEQSIADRIDMIKEKVPLLPKTFWHNDTVQAQALMLQQSGITVDPKYAERLVHLINKHRLYLLDRKWLIQKVVAVILTFIVVKGITFLLQHYWDFIFH